MHRFLKNFWHTAVEFRTSFLKVAASFLTTFCFSGCRRPACTAMRADPLKLCSSRHCTCKAMSLDALIQAWTRQPQKLVVSPPLCQKFFQKSWHKQQHVQTLNPNTNVKIVLRTTRPTQAYTLRLLVVNLAAARGYQKSG